MVVTSDASIQDAVFGGGVDRMSANGFSLEMDDLADEADRDSSLQVSRKNTVADRLNPKCWQNSKQCVIDSIAVSRGRAFAV